MWALIILSFLSLGQLKANQKTCRGALDSVTICQTCFERIDLADEFEPIYEKLKQLRKTAVEECCLGECGRPIALQINGYTISEVQPQDLAKLGIDEVRPFLLNLLDQHLKGEQ